VSHTHFTDVADVSKRTTLNCSIGFLLIKVIREVTLSLGLLSPHFTGINKVMKGNEILLNLSIKCWNSAFNAQGSRVIIVVGQEGSENICRTSGGAEEEGKTGWNSVYHQNWWKIQFGSEIFCFVKFSLSVKRLMPYYAKTGHSRPVIRRLYRELYCLNFWASANEASKGRGKG